MNILFDNSTTYIFDDEKIKIFYDVVGETLKYEGFSDDVEVSISIVDNEEIRKINCKFRNIDKATDVLSFPMIDFEGGEEVDTSETVVLGDIIISIERAISQAEEYGHSIEREIGFLTAHSMLHLLGYDHIEPEEEAVMFSKQREILENVGLKR